MANSGFASPHPHIQLNLICMNMLFRCNQKCVYSDQKCGAFPREAREGPTDRAEVLRMRRGDLMKPDLVSEIVLLGSGAVIFIVCLFIILAALAGQIR